MLVLSRKSNESIVIGGEIRVTVVEIRGDKVRLGIVAPNEVKVNREEIEKLTNPNYKPRRPGDDSSINDNAS